MIAANSKEFNKFKDTFNDFKVAISKEFNESMVMILDKFNQMEHQRSDDISANLRVSTLSAPSQDERLTQELYRTTSLPCSR